MADQNNIAPDTNWPTPIEIVLPWSLIKKKFVTVGEWQEWVATEQKKWMSILDHKPVNSSIQFVENLRPLLIAKTKQLKIQSNQITTRPLGELEGQTQKVVHALHEIEDRNLFIDSESKIFEVFSEAIAENSDRSAAIPFAIAELLKLKILAHNSLDLRLVVDGHSWAKELNGEATANSSDESVTLAINNWNAKLSTVHDAYSNANELLATAMTAADTTRDEELKKWNEFDKESRASVAAITMAFEKKIQLSSAVTYWRNKGRAHLAGYFSYLFLFIVAVLGVIWGSIEMLPGLLESRVEFINNITDKDNNTAFDSAILSLSVLAIASLPVILAIWFLRFLMRQAIQHSRLRDDATMRSKMVHVYLALIKDVGTDKISEKWDQRIILEAIFRPVAVSTEDDGLPNILAAVRAMGKTN